LIKWIRFIKWAAQINNWGIGKIGVKEKDFEESKEAVTPEGLEGTISTVKSTESDGINNSLDLIDPEDLRPNVR
jgi:hypothetical protein